MPAASINHINIKAPAVLLKRCREFYVSVIGLRDGHRPELNDQGYWLYGDASDALIHMTISENRIGGPSYYDHIAFDCVDPSGMRQVLYDLGLPFTEETSLDGRWHQIFLCDPCELRVELNFKLPIIQNKSE